MKNQRLSLADFKAKAKVTSTNEVLEKVKGGSEMGYCHGWLGSFNKWLDDVFDENLQ